jgi:hypothetical protein
MIRKCAWCGCKIGQIQPLEDESLTHGMCERCYDDYMKWLREYVARTSKSVHAHAAVVAVPEPTL